MSAGRAGAPSAIKPPRWRSFSTMGVDACGGTCCADAADSKRLSCLSVGRATRPPSEELSAGAADVARRGHVAWVGGIGGSEWARAAVGAKAWGRAAGLEMDEGREGPSTTPTLSTGAHGPGGAETGGIGAGLWGLDIGGVGPRDTAGPASDCAGGTGRSSAARTPSLWGISANGALAPLFNGTKEPLPF